MYAYVSQGVGFHTGLKAQEFEHEVLTVEIVWQNNPHLSFWSASPFHGLAPRKLHHRLGLALMDTHTNKKLKEQNFASLMPHFKGKNDSRIQTQNPRSNEPAQTQSPRARRRDLARRKSFTSEVPGKRLKREAVLKPIANKLWTCDHQPA